MLSPSRKCFVFVGVVAGHVAVLALFINIRANVRADPERFISTLFFIETAANRRKSSSARRPQSDKPRIAIPAPKIVQEDVSSRIPVAIPPVDWATEREHVAAGVADGFESGRNRSLDSKPKAIELPRPERESRGMFPVGPRREGKSQRFDTGEVITWIDDNCYATNLPSPAPQLDPNSVNIICKDPSRGRQDYFDHLKPKYLMKPGEQRAPDPREENVDNLP